jgi:hypothetical protein
MNILYLSHTCYDWIVLWLFELFGYVHAFVQCIWPLLVAEVASISTLNLNLNTHNGSQSTNKQIKRTKTKTRATTTKTQQPPTSSQLIFM